MLHDLRNRDLERVRGLAPVCIALALFCGCETPPGADVGLDAGEDSPELDAPVDGGCTGEPGVLTGTRELRAGGFLPDLMFATEGGTTHLGLFHRPCTSDVVVIRSLAAWSGPSLWHRGHTADIVAMDGVTLLDLLVFDADGLPPDERELAAWRMGYDAPPDALALDPEERFATLAFGGVRLPLVAIVEARDLRVARVLFAPHATEIEHAVRVVQAGLRGERPPVPRPPELVDGRFPADAWDLVLGMRWAPPPPDPSNRVADVTDAIGFGGTLFEDNALSPAGVACESCHDPARGFTDGRAVGRGVTDVRRNTPTVFGSAHTRWPFWDGRTDSLWAQALGPIESAAEMGSSRLYVAHRVEEAHARGYELLFGPLPPLSDLVRFPPIGAPGDPGYDGMTAADRLAVDTIFVNVGKAIAAFERSLSPPETAFDRYLAGDFEALTDEERDGLSHFVENGCAQCHFGPTLANDAFFNIVMPGHLPPPEADEGRVAALDSLRTSAFRRTGVFSDDPSAEDPLEGITAFAPRLLGAFRTPPLRGLRLTAPYGHAGTFATLRDVVTHYATIRLPMSDPRVVGVLDPHVPSFDPVDHQITPLTAFLETL